MRVTAAEAVVNSTNLSGTDLSGTDIGIVVYRRPWRRMSVGDHIREMRKQKNLSQGDIEKNTGLLRCYISRVENGSRCQVLRL